MSNVQHIILICNTMGGRLIMIVCVTRLNLKKAAVGIVILAAVILGVSTLRGQDEVLQSVSTEVSLDEKLDSIEKQIVLLKSFGVEVDENPITQTEVQIPNEFDETYLNYNELQKQQGLDLEKYKGKRAMLYIYRVKNDESGTNNVTASIVTYKDKLIAADICVPEQDGLLKPIIDTEL